MTADLPDAEELEALAEEFDQDTALQLAILSELTAIRRLLEGDTDDTGTEEATERITCRSCETDFYAADDARRHAREEHGAPEGCEGDLLTVQ